MWQITECIWDHLFRWKYFNLISEILFFVTDNVHCFAQNDCCGTYWSLNEMADILHQYFLMHFFMKIFVCWLKFYLSLFLRVQLKISLHWFRWWLGPLIAVIWTVMIKFYDLLPWCTFQQAVGNHMFNSLAPGRFEYICNFQMDFSDIMMVGASSLAKLP